MDAAAGQRALVDQIEALVQEEVGRNIAHLCAAARGGLWTMASAIAAAPAPVVGVITGFFVPRATPPAAETDGPIGAALLLRALSAAGIACRMATDEPCRATCAAALVGAGIGDLPLDVVALGAPLDPLVAAWTAAGVTHALSIERCGLAADGRPRNLRGADIGAFTAPMDHLFLGGPWRKLAIGDGGNEIGMGRLPAGLIARSVPNGEQIACVTSCDHLVVAGVSNWGAYGVMAALAVQHAEWSGIIRKFLTAERDLALTRAIVEQAGAVDGVTARREPTVDGFGADIHGALVESLARVAWGKAGD